MLAVMPRPRWVFAVAAALLLAGCAGGPDESQTPPDHGEKTREETYDSRIASDQRRVYNFTLGTDGAVQYDLFVRNGKMSLTVMDASEARHFMEGVRVRTHHESPTGADVKETISLAPGAYALGLRCHNLREDCPYLLKLAVFERKAPDEASGNATA